jgi:hypothetical protein
MPWQRPEPGISEKRARKVEECEKWISVSFLMICNFRPLKTE